MRGIVATEIAESVRGREINMSIVHRGTTRGVWGIFLLGIISTVFYSVTVLMFTVFPHIFSQRALVLIADYWADIGGIYIVTQVLPIVTRPLTKDAWEVSDHISSFVAAAIVVLVFPIAWGIRGEWPSFWVWKVWHGSVWISAADVLLTLVSLKISKNASRITPA